MTQTREAPDFFEQPYLRGGNPRAPHGALGVHLRDLATALVYPGERAVLDLDGAALARNSRIDGVGHSDRAGEIIGVSRGHTEGEPKDGGCCRMS